MDVVVPVLHKAGEKQEMSSVEICYKENWQIRIWKPIVSAYGKAPYFLYYADKYEQLLNRQTKLLVDWNYLILEQLSHDLTFTMPNYCEFWKTSYTDRSDLREVIHPKKKSPFEIPAYHQVFSEKFNFQPGVSCLDLLFNMGPDASSFLRTISITG